MFGDVAYGLFKAVGRVLIEVVVKLLIIGPGYLIARFVTRGDVDPDGAHCLVCGLLFWGAVVVTSYLFLGFSDIGERPGDF